MPDDPHGSPPQHELALAPDQEEGVIETVPDDVREAALRALMRRDRSAEVLDLAHDSLLDDRTGAEPRRVTFGKPGQAVQIDVEAAPGPAGPSLTVRCASPGAHLTEVQVDDAAPSVQVVSQGAWRVDALPHGLVSLVVRVDDQRFRTAWLRF